MIKLIGYASNIAHKTDRKNRKTDCNTCYSVGNISKMYNQLAWGDK